MRAVTFPGWNLNLAENQEEYEAIPVLYLKDNPEGQMVACFELNKDEIEEIVRTGKLWYVQHTFNRGFQPINMSTECPITYNNEQ